MQKTKPGQLLLDDLAALAEARIRWEAKLRHLTYTPDMISRATEQELRNMASFLWAKYLEHVGEIP